MVMQEVRELLDSGAPSGEVIARGYAPGTVYKVQRQMRRSAGSETTPRAANVMAQQSSASPTGEPGEAQALRQRVAELEAKLAEAEEVRQRLLGRTYSLGWANIDATTWQTLWEGPSPSDSLSTLVHWLEVESDAMRTRVEKAEAASEKERTAHVEAERQAESVRQELGAKLRDSSDAHVKARQAATWAQRQLDDEKTARVRAERQWQLWADKTTELERSNQRLTQIAAELEPLRVWVGHPCKVCKKPMSGVVDRELAAKLEQDLAHVTCIKKGGEGSPWVPLAIGAGLLYGLSRQR